jgi:hypothetical protein
VGINVDLDVDAVNVDIDKDVLAEVVGRGNYKISTNIVHRR